MSALTELLGRHVDEGTAPGILAALGSADAAPEVAAAGDLAPDAVVRIQSMTKPVLAVATLRLVAAGRLTLDDPVARWLPELAEPRVLRTPEAELDDTVPARGPVTVRHLLTNTSGHGMILTPSPLQTAMAERGVEAGPQPWALPADDWLSTLAGLPLVGQPGQVWRYHHSFGMLGILLTRALGRPLGEHLAEDLLTPLGMVDTAYLVPAGQAHRLPAAHRREEDGTLVEVDPAGSGPFVAAPDDTDGAQGPGGTPDLSHGELVSTLHDYAAFARMLAAGGVHDGRQVVDPGLLHLMRTDQVPAVAKTPDSFFPGFWESNGWGFGVAVETAGPHAGRYGWSGGLGTDVFVDPGGRYGVLLTQVEMGPPAFRLIADLQQL